MCAVLMVGAASAEEPAHPHQPGMNHGLAPVGATPPSEGGQSGFVAIQEIVLLLEANPKTDWSKVNIESLRQHLIDMDNVTLRTGSTATQAGNSLLFTVTGEGDVVSSIQRMVTGHVKTMNGVEGWTFTSTRIDRGATMTVTPPDQVAMLRLKALGFIGIMSRGMHHQQHHLAIATGVGEHE